MKQKNEISNTANRCRKPDHLQMEVWSGRLPRWLILWMNENEESAGHIVRESVIEHNQLTPPTADEWSRMEGKL